MKEKGAGVWYFYGMLIFLILWQAAASWLQLPIIPSPGIVLVNLLHIFLPQIAVHGLYSLWRIVAGVLVAVLIGVPLGLCMGYFSKWDRLLSPLVYLTYPIPKIALLPVVMLLLGLGEGAKILMIFLIVVFQVIVAVRDGVKGIPKETYYPLYSLGAGFTDIFRDILIPASMPKFLTALRVAMATAVSVLFFTETFGTQYGMGYFIMDAWLRVNYLEMYSGIVVLSTIGLILFGTIDYLERKLCGWQYK
ncbi:Putative aliphatic sulfonates transport permease protein SsuC [Sporomusa ovata DSM 2662]|uniref:Binding-protein-dependent transport systems inner membrane component n=1 Tax=Sporomusa ovata TaxID=2378 RepID=A0A0U1KUN2_9FIRM|nr:ABC transporter permease [Sporomusa ovata]EQB26745.1 ABC-type nitrate/sulfonate/bicarbonate transport system, permease component [Sporomusa ovata DSM 2662]CQR70839.1 Binding-protein-dependent transport systems inner membrane component [Sporomusa ovata]